MLVGNAIEGLLKFRIRRTDDHCQFCYEITSRQPLGRLLETKSINAVQLRALLLGIAPDADPHGRLLCCQNIRSY